MYVEDYSSYPQLVEYGYCFFKLLVVMLPIIGVAAYKLIVR